MNRWLAPVAWFVPVFAMAGCLPPVEEVTDTTPPSQNAESAEKDQKMASAGQSTDEGGVTPAGGTTESAGTPGDFQTTASGLKYKIVRPGSGKKPRSTDEVTCHYKGWLDDGTVFDSSYQRGEPTSFPLNGVIKGWTEGLQLIGEGGEVELEIPSKLGYGPAGHPPTIPGGATLHFKVELVKVN